MNYIVDDIKTVVEAMRPTGADANALKTSAIKKFGLPFYTYIKAINQDGDLASIPYYLYGSRKEIIRQLTEMQNDSTRVYKKYPLIALGMDIPEKPVGGLIEFNLNIALMCLTDIPTYIQDRYANIFKPVLYPMYKKFLEEFRNAGLFLWDGEQNQPPHEKFDRPYWGTSNDVKGNTENKYNDPLDAIELLNFTFRQEIKC